MGGCNFNYCVFSLSFAEVVNMEKIIINSNQRNQFIDITKQAEEIVKNSLIKKGTCLVFCPHTTAAITINENADRAVQKDIINYLNQAVPQGNYTHLEGNSDAHIKSSLLGVSKVIAVEQGRLLLGTWQGIYFCEFDGPRCRQVYVQVTKN